MAQKNKTLYESLLNFQKQLPDIAKSKTAGLGKFSYSYLPLEDLLSAIQPVLHANGLIIIQPQAYNDHGQTCIVTRLIHVESGEEIKSELPIFLPQDMGKKEMFTWGGSLTYGRRYAIKMLLGIEPDMDTNTEDPKEITDKVKPEKKTGISRTPTRPDSQVKKTEVKNNEFITPAAKTEISGKIGELNDANKKKVLDDFKQHFDIKAKDISPQHITLAAHGRFLQQAISQLA
tara:strand:+ start:5587 stop:6282 length:696 start_codon:yes stop_codon:yes gene_type:complete